MGQSFLTHDEKSSGSPSPDLLQFNGASSNPKFFGSLSSVKEASTSSSSRSPLLESVDSEDQNATLSSSASSSSARSPQSPSNATGSSDLYSSLIPTPILPGNVSRLREKFMATRKGFSVDTGQTTIYRNENARGKEAISDPDCRYITRPATTSPGITGRGSRRGTLPTARSRSSLSALSPVLSYGKIKSRIRTLPPPSSTYDEKLNLIRSDHDLSECFRNMSLVGTCNNNMGNFANETPLVRHRPRTRPYVPPPRSVIIRAGYLPTLQNVNMIPSRRASASASHVGPPSPRREQNVASKSNSECVATVRTSTSIPQLRNEKEELRLVSSPSTSTARSPLEADYEAHVVTKHEDHREKKVLMKDAEVNTSAEVLVLPKGTKTSVLLKSGIMDEVDGAKGLKRRRRKKRGIRRVARVFRRIMIGFVELF